MSRWFFVPIVQFLLLISLSQQKDICEPFGDNLTNVCENHLPTDACITIFGKNKIGQKRPKRCESPYLQDEALLCAKHCRICCQRKEHECRDGRKGEDEGRYCRRSLIEQKCWKEDMLAEMTKECAGTCGLCQRQKRKWEEELMCRDKQWDCADMKPFCAIDERVQRICPKTCQSEWKNGLLGVNPCQQEEAFYEFLWQKPTEDEDCLDTRADCRKDMFFCDMPNYFERLKEECPQTCAHCKSSGHKCVDRNAEKCAKWQIAHKHRPFCQSHHFSKGVKFHWCPKTCEMC